METRILTSPDDFERYGQWLAGHPHASLWQSLEWKGYQESLGRTVKVYAALEGREIVASALVVVDRTSFGLSTWEIPRGPLVSGKWKVESGKLIEKVMSDAKRYRCLSVYISPPETLSIFNFQFSTSSRLVYPEATRIIDLTLNEEGLLGQMKPKGRYNIGVAQKHGITVKESTDAGAYQALAAETAARDGFRGHRGGYEGFLRHLPGSFLLLAYGASPEPIAGLLGVSWGTTGIYYYGASSSRERELMAPYLLQWEAMRLCKAKGCTQYDLFGIAPEDAVNHPWSGVSEFKAKFGGHVVSYPPEQQVTLRPVMACMLKMKRKIAG